MSDDTTRAAFRDVLKQQLYQGTLPEILRTHERLIADLRRELTEARAEIAKYEKRCYGSVREAT